MGIFVVIDMSGEIVVWFDIGEMGIIDVSLFFV